MSAISIGGAIIVSMELTYSWGGTPASAKIEARGSTTLSAGDSVVLAVDALTFYGIVVSEPVDVSDSSGPKVSFQIVDNRERLKEDTVKCRFNKMIISEDDPSTPGIDRWKHYEHIYPGTDWESQKKTFTNTPHTAREILEKVFDSTDVRVTWVRNYHTAQAKPCHEIDANHGKKLLNLILEVTEAQGLVFTLAGSNVLNWSRKGDDTAPTPDHTACYDLSSGASLNANDTQIIVIGDANRYQELSIDMEPDWKSPWEDFWIEAAWRDEVNTRFGPYSDDDEGQAELTVKARSVTVRDYVTIAGTTFADFGKYGQVSRMEIPAWLYLTKIVYHAYRVPLTYTINGIARENLRLVREMLIAVEVDLDTGSITQKSPDELYPDGYGFVAAQGQQIGIIDPRTQRYITPDQLTNAREKWTQMSHFTVDEENYVIFFDDAVFLPGTDAEALFIFPNQSVTGLDTTDPLYNLCLPNANVSVAPAAVKASLTFDAELYSKSYGSGRRLGPMYVTGLNFHSILDAGANIRQITYQDGTGADDKSADYAASKIDNTATYAYGGFTRKGSAGTALNGSIDRVTATLNTTGISERIEYTKERGPRHFVAEDELQRRQKEKDRYPGERRLAQDVRDLKTLASLLGGTSTKSAGIYSHPADVMQRPVGCEHSAPRLVHLESPKDGGVPVFVNEAGAIDNAGKMFIGVTIADGASGNGVALATQGVVPVRVKGPFNPNDAVGADDTGASAVNGPKLFGTILGTYSGNETVLVEVRLGGNPQNDNPGAFDLISLNSSGSLKLRPGTVNGLVMDNPFDAIDCSAHALTYVKLHCQTTSYQVNQVTWLADATPATPPPALKGAPPLNFDVTIGMVVKTTVGSVTSYTYWPVWMPKMIVLATPKQWMSTDRATPAPGQTFQEIWWSWEVKAAAVIIVDS